MVIPKLIKTQEQTPVQAQVVEIQVAQVQKQKPQALRQAVVVPVQPIRLLQRVLPKVKLRQTALKMMQGKSRQMVG